MRLERMCIQCKEDVNCKCNCPYLMGVCHKCGHEVVGAVGTLSKEQVSQLRRETIVEYPHRT